MNATQDTRPALDRKITNYICKSSDPETGVIRSVDGFINKYSYAAAHFVLPGDVYSLETIGSFIVGVLHEGVWYDRLSDDEYYDRREAEAEAFAQQRRNWLEENQDRLLDEESALPDWIRERIEYFHEHGENFEEDGWGYEMCIANLAVMYYHSNNEETDEIMEYANREGTSGNQHEVAKALARGYREGMSLAGTVGGMSMLTGKAYY